MKLTLPDQLLFGYWASAPFPFLLIVAKSHKDNAALIAHEQCHQAQQRRDGWMVFWLRYTTSKSHRMAYELEAYRVWLTVDPHDAWRKHPGDLYEWAEQQPGFRVLAADEFGIPWSAEHG